MKNKGNEIIGTYLAKKGKKQEKNSSDTLSVNDEIYRILINAKRNYERKIEEYKKMSEAYDSEVTFVIIKYKNNTLKILKNETIHK